MAVPSPTIEPYQDYFISFFCSSFSKMIAGAFPKLFKCFSLQPLAIIATSCNHCNLIGLPSSAINMHKRNSEKRWIPRNQGNKPLCSTPCFVHPSVGWSFLGSGPKGPMSCRTQGWISRRPFIRTYVRTSVHPSPLKLLRLKFHWITWKIEEMQNFHRITWKIDKKCKNARFSLNYMGNLPEVKNIWNPY